jgi:hypothetical protein
MTKAEKDGFKAQILDEIIEVLKKARKGSVFDAKEFARLLLIRTKKLRGTYKKGKLGIVADSS